MIHSLNDLELDEALVSQLKHELSVENELNSKLFDALQSRCFNLLTSDSLLFPGFRKSRFYIEMLSQLDLMEMEKKADQGKFSDLEE